MSEHILIIDDEPEMLSVLGKLLTSKGYRVQQAESGEQAWKAIEETMFDLIISDMALPDISGLEILERVRATDSTLPFIIVTGVGTIESAVQAIQLGAFHYIIKPYKRRDIEILTQRALEFGKLHRKLDNIRPLDGEAPSLSMMTGSSKLLMDLLRRVEKVSDSEASVLIQGETGTGKSLLARKIHENSSRRDKPFLTIDCGALTETLLESELFGHVKGAFSGAICAKRGLLEEAQGGTIFLDEIGEISLPTQVKLLRAIQEKIIKAVGGNKDIPIAVRFISATSKDLRDEIIHGRFREELYYRLNVIPLQLPPLRERLDDLLPLIDHFLEKFCKLYKKRITQIRPEVLQAFHCHPWKGNIRELANILERGVLLAENESLTMDCVFLDNLRRETSREERDEGPKSLRETVEEAETRAIVLALKVCNNNRSRAAEMLKISRRALYDKIELYNITNKFLIVS
jgi:DNA-binding NtrC family response regulator